MLGVDGLSPHTPNPRVTRPEAENPRASPAHREQKRRPNRMTDTASQTRACESGPDPTSGGRPSSDGRRRQAKWHQEERTTGWWGRRPTVRATLDRQVLRRALPLPHRQGRLRSGRRPGRRLAGLGADQHQDLERSRDQRAERRDFRRRLGIRPRRQRLRRCSRSGWPSASTAGSPSAATTSGRSSGPSRGSR